MKILRFVPAILWMGFIFYLSTQQTTSIHGSVTQRFYILKSFHLIEYGTLAILLYFATLKYNLTVLVAYLYALSDEFHQRFTPGRTSKFTDTLIDLLGITLGLIFIKIFLTYFQKYHHKLD